MPVMSDAMMKCDPHLVKALKEKCMPTLIKQGYLMLLMTPLTLMTATAKDAALANNAHFITEQLMIPTSSSESWQWNDFEKLPNPKNYQLEKSPNKYSRNEGDYTLSRDVIGDKAIKVSGSKAEPRVVMFTGYDKKDGAWELSQIVHTANVTTLKSNCTLKNISSHYRDPNITISFGRTLEYQNFYKWQRAGSQPLYIAESKGEGYVASSTYNPYSWKDYTLVRDPKIFNEYHIWDIMEDGEQVMCHFD